MSVEVEVGGIGVYEPAADLTPSGVIVAFGGSSAPSGWLFCNGDAVSRTNNANLFAAIGITWGDGDGSTTFNLPDLQGVFLRGAGANNTLKDANDDAFNGGDVGDSANDKIQGHWHNIDNSSYGLKYGTYGASASGAFSAETGGGSASNYKARGLVTDGSSGTPRTGNETQPVNVTVNYIIKI